MRKVLFIAVLVVACLLAAIYFMIEELCFPKLVQYEGVIFAFSVFFYHSIFCGRLAWEENG